MAVLLPTLFSGGVLAVSGPRITFAVIGSGLNSFGLIYIYGSGFGTAPSTVSATNGGVDTVFGGTTPSLAICDVTQGWNAGGSYAGGTTLGHGCIFQPAGPNAIGVFIYSWSNDRIVLTGLVLGGYHLNSGDSMVIIVFGPNHSGSAFYLTTYTP